MRGRVKNDPPDRWGAYSNFSGVINECQVLPCKTPLKEQIFRKGINCNLLREDQHFTPQDLCKMVGEELDKRVEFIFDFTNTDRYYDRFNLAESVKYIKIGCIGKCVPPKEVYTKFHTKMESCIRDISPQGVIAVHCTHGVNRTGFIICNYLMNKFGYSLEEAVDAFNLARGHNIEREEYIEALRVARYPAPSQDEMESLEKREEVTDMIVTDSMPKESNQSPQRSSRRAKRKRKDSLNRKFTPFTPNFPFPSLDAPPPYYGPAHRDDFQFHPPPPHGTYHYHPQPYYEDYYQPDHHNHLRSYSDQSSSRTSQRRVPSLPRKSKSHSDRRPRKHRVNTPPLTHDVITTRPPRFENDSLPPDHGPQPTSIENITHSFPEELMQSSSVPFEELEQLFPVSTETLQSPLLPAAGEPDQLLPQQTEELILSQCVPIGLEERISRKPNQELESHKSTEDLVESHTSTENIVESHKSTENIVESHKSTENIVESHKSTENIVESHKSTENIVESLKYTEDLVESLKFTEEISQSHPISAEEMVKLPMPTGEPVEQVEPVHPKSPVIITEAVPSPQDDAQSLPKIPKGCFQLTPISSAPNIQPIPTSSEENNEPSHIPSTSSFYTYPKDDSHSPGGAIQLSRLHSKDIPQPRGDDTVSIPIPPKDTAKPTDLSKEHSPPKDSTHPDPTSSNHRADSKPPKNGTSSSPRSPRDSTGTSHKSPKKDPESNPTSSKDSRRSPTRRKDRRRSSPRNSHSKHRTEHSHRRSEKYGYSNYHPHPQYQQPPYHRGYSDNSYNRNHYREYHHYVGYDPYYGHDSYRHRSPPPPPYYPDHSHYMHKREYKPSKHKREYKNPPYDY